MRCYHRHDRACEYCNFDPTARDAALPAVERLSAYISSNTNPLHHASPSVIADALEACGLTLVEQVSA